MRPDANCYLNSYRERYIDGDSYGNRDDGGNGDTNSNLCPDKSGF